MALPLLCLKDEPPTGWFAREKDLPEDHPNERYIFEEELTIDTIVRELCSNWVDTNWSLRFYVEGVEKQVEFLRDPTISPERRATYFLQYPDDKDPGEEYGPWWFYRWDEIGDGTAGMYVAHTRFRLTAAEEDAMAVTNLLDRRYLLDVQCQLTYFRSHWSKTFPNSAAYNEGEPRRRLTSPWVERGGIEISIAELAEHFVPGFLYNFIDPHVYHRDAVRLARHSVTRRPDNAAEAVEIYGEGRILLYAILHVIFVEIVPELVQTMDMAPPDGPNYIELVHNNALDGSNRNNSNNKRARGDSP
jgi:hypothetical protein